jgi:hypothetical protein
MKLIKFIFWAGSIFIIVCLLYAGYLGYFKSVHIDEKMEGGYILVGQSYIGAYSDAGKNISKTRNKIFPFKLKSQREFGVYYNNPQREKDNNCHYFVGVILENTSDLEKISKLQAAGLFIDSIPKTHSLYAEFPFKSEFSYMVGPLKIYPAFNTYLSEHKYDTKYSIEIYNEKADKIIYLMPFDHKN